MKSDLLVKLLLVATLATSVFAEDMGGNSDNDLKSWDGKKAQDTKDHRQLRIGMLSGSGIYHLKDGSGNHSSNINMKSASGYEFSLVSGKSNQKGFDLRSVLTLQFNSWNNGYVTDVSDIMFLGGGEFAYNINKYISPFIGYYGGIGVADAGSDTNYYTGANYDNSSQLAYDLGLFAGVSGEFYESLGYYAKYNFYSYKGFNIDENTIGVRMSPTTLKIGISYTF